MSDSGKQSGVSQMFPKNDWGVSMKKLTQTLVDNAKVPAGKDEEIIPDSLAPGLKLRIRKEGARVYIFQRRFAGQHPKITIGDAASWPLEAARRTARELAVKMDGGIDPRQEQAAKIEAAKTVFAGVMTDYLDARKRDLKPRTFVETRHHLEHHWQPLHNLSISGITRATVATRLREIAKGSGLVAADRARSALSAMFSWTIGEGLCESNPVTGTNKNDVDKPRDRILSDDEIARLWQALPENDYGNIIRLLLLTGCRRDEIGSLAWSEVDFEGKALRIPGARTKNHREHYLPLPHVALKILKSVEGRDGRDLVFGSGEGGFSGWSHAKTALDEKLNFKEAWRLHDLRRTCRSGLGRLGIPPHVGEATLNHLPGKLIQTYDRHTYAAEKKSALAQWAAHVEAVVAGKKGSNVVALKA